jgi:hypothetical protein
MKSNSLPAQYSSTIRLIRFLLNKPKPKFEDNEDKIEAKHHTTIKINKIEKCKDYKINELFKDLKPYSQFVQVFLHGSWADNTRTLFSDIDDYIILDIKGLRENKLIFKVLRILNTIDMKFCRIDPIQHHGHWLCSKEDLTNYDNSFMPLEILKEAKSVFGNSFIEGIVNSELSEKGLKQNILNTCDSIKRLSELYFNRTINAYQLKCLVGSFVIMPAYIFQVRGEDLSKPEAIVRAKTIFSGKSTSCIKWSTDNRNNWVYITKNKKYKIFATFSYLFFDPHLWRRFSSYFSPKVSDNQNNQLSNIVLTTESVTNFITESLEYAK